MKKISAILIIFAFILSFTSLVFASEIKSADFKGLDKKSRGFIELLKKKNYKAATGYFDEVMKKEFAPEKLKKVWESLIHKVGQAQKITGMRIEKKDKYNIVFVTTKFEKYSFDLKLVFDSRKLISGMWFVPTKSAVKYKSPGYVKPGAFTEKEVTVGKGKWALPGTLSIPKGKGPFPVILLVHGSGPNDRDETVGSNKPFKDLAHGLASTGVAVLRYEKRTKHHGAKLLANLKKLTSKEETIDDAVLAVKLLKKMKKIDPKKIYVLGHSLGGMFIPRIAEAAPSARGFIIMAGTSKPLEDVIWYQYNYIFSLDGKISDDEKKELAKLKKQIARVKDPGLTKDTALTELPLGMPASFWLDVRDYKPAVEAKKIKRPVLVIQGERDYQVTMDDYRGWKNALSGKKNVSFITYPLLNHLFIPGKGKSIPAEYMKPGNVSKKVVEDMARWIKKN
ncbi:MAG: alpha/beta fold hydrolase [Candidatus Eremiobacteraeota bacterium]|nr:alpha/beta fold hydrolase [Candidatus Eremiobacteraeota bacterium]